MERERPLRHASNWDVLEALDDLNPPSPSPSLEFGGISPLCDSGEISVFLFTGSNDQSVPQPAAEEELNTELFIIHSPSGSTVDLAGNAEDYGSTREQGHRGWYSDSAYQNTSAVGPHGSSVSPSMRENHYPPSPTLSTHCSFIASGKTTPLYSVPTSPAVESPFLSSRSFYDYQQYTSAENDTRHSSSMPFRSPSSSSTLCMALFGSGTLLSPSPSFITTDVDCAPSAIKRDCFPFRRHQKTKSSSLLSDRGGRSRSPSPQPEVSSAPVSPIMPTFDIRLPPSPRLASLKNSAKPSRSARSSHISSPLATSSSKSVNIPGILDWLREIELELWIDQEGSRTMWPTFTLVGYSSDEISDDRNFDLVNALTYGAAHFQPAKRQTYVLHRGNLDTPLVLRRLTLVGDESKDYISRQASLVISSNGVYGVSGTELFENHPHSPHGHLAHSQQQPLKLQWRFEYKVDDLVSDTGITAPGEKTFTPLGLWCSPALLHPTHGKKTKLMQVFRKSLAPRLSAEKLGASIPSRHPVGDKENATASSLGRRRALSSESSALPACDRDEPGVEHRNGRPASFMVVSREHMP